jgi:S-adenosylmethionine decarboxylase
MTSCNAVGGFLWRNLKMTVGIHIIADLYGVDEELISTSEKVLSVIEESVRISGLTKISSDYFQFQPRGVSGIVLLAESHLSFHTWPEHNLVTLDIYTCGDPHHADLAFNYIVTKLSPTSIDYKKLTRGNQIAEDVKIATPEHVIIQ